MKRHLLLFVLLMIIGRSSQAQEVPSPALTADSLATGNYKDVLSSFFQLSLEKLTGPDKELKFTSTPFAVMARLDTNLLTDINYLKYTTLRNINFAFSAKLDSNYKFNGFSSAVKYAIINKRDETVSRAFLELVANNASVKEIFQLNTLMGQFISSLPAAQRANAATQIDDFVEGRKGFGELDKAIQDGILDAAQRSPLTPNLSKTLNTNKKFNIHTAAAEIYEKMKKEYNNNLLWTVGISDTTYKDQFLFSNINLTTELLQGISNSSKKNDVELNVKGSFQFVDDTLKTGRDLKRSVLSFEPGVNIVLKGKDTGKSFFEFKLSGSYYRVFSGQYLGEEKDKLTLNGTIRVRILNDIWIPLEIKYDPKQGNFFGFLNVKANFTALGEMAKTLKL